MSAAAVIDWPGQVVHELVHCESERLLAALARTSSSSSSSSSELVSRSDSSASSRSSASSYLRDIFSVSTLGRGALGSAQVTSRNILYHQDQ